MPNAISQHGVFVNMFNTGVLIQGPAGSGKSELALGLIDRGHQLIADDVVLLALNRESAIIGSCPDELYGWLAINSLGVLNISQLFGEKALYKQQQLHLIITLDPTHEPITQPLTMNQATTTLLGQSIPELYLNADTNRARPLLLETMVKHYLGKHQHDFLHHHQQLLENPA